MMGNILEPSESGQSRTGQGQGQHLLRDINIFTVVESGSLVAKLTSIMSENTDYWIGLTRLP